MTANAVAIARPAFAETLRNYITLTKPRVISLLLVTTVPAMVVADDGWPGHLAGARDAHRRDPLGRRGECHQLLV